MKQSLKSQRSRELILAAGLRCFSQNGYKATSMKDIARGADISIGRVYHHFDNKLQVFTELLDNYWRRLEDPELPLNQLILKSNFPNDIPALAEAIRDIVVSNRESIMLIYIDVIEFQGTHIQRFYHNMAANFKNAFGDHFDRLRREGALHEDADPLFAVMMCFRFLFQYYLVETSFGVENHFGIESEEVGGKVSQLLLHGLLDPSRKPHGVGEEPSC
ncbi:TetR/AcrR family transcriptional regulator [Acanthopleuribacter pedis]|uniref:TetR/AcrR family transcriptional regulator n=1 Tax=Acanthopleuribacter pedis TaxID=442870 RepID=A0A8J7QF19_9BACT|nr:TetR/AcrR family transcriptional regulator [Acanthopleuribacter pedis]MBO1317298.1 TetR/AcrR family transcriptional regulator [Acanthopleuribacter pedis]MBO1318605.1 TetR/AcrR family transcriptional regulator [Acanthopleuribacter pedis]